MRNRGQTTAVSLLLTAIAVTSLAAAANAAGAADVGVSDQPCRSVPVQPTAAHQASADPYQNWMHDWLSRDWGQLCRYQQQNAALPPATRTRVVFFGDSLTDNWQNLQPDFFGPQQLDRGISGQTTGQMLVRFRADVIDLHPAVVHILAGTNDIAGNNGPTSLAIIQGNIASMAEQARAHGARVIIASILPAARFGWRPEIEPVAAIAAMNAWLRDYAAREHFIYVDYFAALNDGHGGFKAELASDGVHPNVAGYALMRPLAEQAVRQALQQPRRWQQPR